MKTSELLSSVVSASSSLPYKHRRRGLIPWLSIGLSAFYICGCTTVPQEPELTEMQAQYSDAYAVYPGYAGSGISKHLIRSHSTAILVRPGSSALELCSRGTRQVWDWMRRLETRLIKFPLLQGIETPEAVMGPGSMDLADFETYLDRLTGSPATTASIELLIDGERFYTALRNSIEQAESTIDIQTYLFDNDDVAYGIADQLRARSMKVDVRVIYDGLGTYLSHTATAPSQTESEEYIENVPRYLCKGSKIRLRVSPNIWLSGNHVKTMIFDDRIAYMGGMNIGREYLHDWHDMMVRMEGAAVGILSENFNKTWRHNGWGGDFSFLLPTPAEPEIHQIIGEVPVRFLYTLPTSAQIYRAQLEAIRRCRSYIYIQNCYFSDDRILYEVCKASRRGVDVRVILPSVVNHKVMETSNRTAINTLLEHGARVYLYPKMSHIKAAVYDGWACFGTANFDKLSLQVIREVNIATSDPETVQQLIEQLFEPDFQCSTEQKEPVDAGPADHIIELIADEI